MPQVRSAKGPPAPKFEPASLLLKIGAFFAIFIGLICAYEFWAMHSDFRNSTRERVVLNDRVRDEFGSDVHMPIGLGWKSDQVAYFYAYLSGSDASGFVSARVTGTGAHQQFPELRVYDLTEDHVINLSPQPPAVTRDQLHARARLYLVPLGSSAKSEVEKIAAFLSNEFAVSSQILPVMEPSQQAFDAKRHQWIAEMLSQEMAAKFPEIAADPESRLLGIIDADLYLRNWQMKFAFNFREANKYAVIPTARLDPAFYGRPPSRLIRMERLQKIVAKNVGLIYFDFQTTDDPKSVMLFAQNQHDLDEISGKYLSSDLRSQPQSKNTAGSPCLNFFTANIAGVPRLRPINACAEPYDSTVSTFYQLLLRSGEFRIERNDLFQPGPLPLVIRRMHFSHAYDGRVAAFGKSSWQSLDDSVVSIDPQRTQTINVGGVNFERSARTPGEGFSPNAIYIAGERNGDFSNAVLSYDAGRWKITNPDGTVWHYLICGANTPVQCLFMGRENVAGDSIQVVRGDEGKLETVRQRPNINLSPAGLHNHSWTFSYSGKTIQSISDDDGTSLHYAYDSDGYLTDVEGNGHTLHYGYDDRHRMNQIVEDGRPLLVHYDPEGRADEIKFPDGSYYKIHYGGETIEISTPKEIYSIRVREDFFETTKQPLD